MEKLIVYKMKHKPHKLNEIENTGATIYSKLLLLTHETIERRSHLKPFQMGMFLYRVFLYIHTHSKYTHRGFLFAISIVIFLPIDFPFYSYFPKCDCQTHININIHIQPVHI